MPEKDIYKMKLHDEISIGMSHEIKILRVPDGWIYTFYTHKLSHNDWEIAASVFVEFNNEFQDPKDYGRKSAVDSESENAVII